MPTKIYPALQQAVLMAFLRLASSPSHPPIHLLPPFFFFEQGVLSIFFFFEKHLLVYDFPFITSIFQDWAFLEKKIRCFSPLLFLLGGVLSTGTGREKGEKVGCFLLMVVVIVDRNSEPESVPADKHRSPGDTGT